MEDISTQEFNHNNLDLQYQNLLRLILDTGINKSDRTGTGTKSVFGCQIVHHMEHGFPLLTTKKMFFKGIVTELLWFLRGDTNIKFLVDNDCHIWNGDAWTRYINEFRRTCPKCPEITKEEFINKIKIDDEFAKKWGDLGPIYGEQWRACTGMYIDGEYEIMDQIANLIKELKTNPDSRRLLVSAWNVAEIDTMVSPPCHYSFQVYTREMTLDERVFLYMRKKNLKRAPKEITLKQLKKENIPMRTISLMWNQRSVDVFLGLPFNIASYGLLLMMIADEVNMHPEWLLGSLGDTHLYNTHIEAAKEQITREPYPLPKVTVRDGIFCSSINDIILENYQSHPTIKALLSN